MTQIPTYADVTAIDQQEECQSKDREEVFHIQIVLSAIDAENFVERSLMMVAWETHNMDETP